MSAARTPAPNVDAIARDLAKQNPGWNRERLYNEAHAAFVVRMRAYTNDVVKRVTADPVVMSAVRVQRAQQEARRVMRPQPADMATLLNRERDRLIKHEGCTLEEAIVNASETVRETMRLWERDHLQETTTILQRDAAIPVQLASPRAPAAKAAAPAPRYFNPGMSPSELKDAAARGQLPVRMGAPPNEKHMRIQDRVKLLQATRADCRDYTAAFIAATKEVADEIASEGEAPAVAQLTGRVADRAKQLRELHEHYKALGDRDPVVTSMARLYADCDTEAGALAKARAQLAAEDAAAAKAGAT